MNMPGERQDVRAYLAAIEVNLGDLPAEERQDVLDDLAAHLAEVAAEGDESLTSRLGPPEAYAEELRASAGYASLRQEVPTKRETWMSERARRWWRSAYDFLPEARPGWWLVRGPLAMFALLAAARMEDTHGFRPVGPFGLLLVLAVLIASVVGSVALGRRAAAGEATIVSALTNIAVVVLVVLALGGVGRGRHDGVMVVEKFPPNRIEFLGPKVGVKVAPAPFAPEVVPPVQMTTTTTTQATTTTTSPGTTTTTLP